MTFYLMNNGLFELSNHSSCKAFLLTMSLFFCLSTLALSFIYDSLLYKTFVPLPWHSICVSNVYVCGLQNDIKTRSIFFTLHYANLY